MNKCAPETHDLALSKPVSLGLRHAQRAFGALIEAYRRVGEFRGAQLRLAARRTLSELSADDRAALSDWLSLQLAAADAGESELGLLARVDMRIVARVRRALPERVESLAIRARPNHIVAA